MFEELFKDPKSIDQYWSAPLVECRLQYLQHRAESGARPGTLCVIATHQLRLVHLLDLREGDRVSIPQIEAAAGEWSCPALHRYQRPASNRTRAEFFGHAVQWLRFMGWLEEPTEVRHPHTAEVAVFEQWMREERGFSEETIRSFRSGANEFFDWLAGRDIPLASVRITDIDGAIAAKSARRQYSRITIRHYGDSLRAFFRFAEGRDWCMPGMATAILLPRIYQQETVPAGLNREDVRRLLATTEGGRPVDKRDRAILMLLIAYGMRSGEVRNLELDDLDWENETLRLRRPKPGRTHLYPLSRGVGQAILRYILEVRPSCPKRTLFLTLLAPPRPLSQAGLGEVVRSRLERLGVVTGRRGPHALRHAAAQHLLDQGMSMKVIGDFLGHRDPASTAIYAKVDLKTLREVADFDLEGLA